MRIGERRGHEVAGLAKGAFLGSGQLGLWEVRQFCIKV